MMAGLKKSQATVRHRWKPVVEYVLAW